MANLFKIYNGDYAKDGYNSGIEDAKAKRPQNKFRFFKAIHPVNYVWNFDNSYHSFMKNYDKGYLDGQRVNNHIYDDQHHSKGGTNNMHDTSLERQITLLENFENDLNVVYRQIERLNEKYKGQIGALANLGFISNYVDTLNDRYVTFDGKIANILSTIQSNLQTIQAQKNALISALNTSRG